MTYFVYKRSRTPHMGGTGPGDLVGAITAGAAVFAVFFAVMSSGTEDAGSVGSTEPSPGVNQLAGAR
ncbi:hypothetical protein [Streptomyces sp. NPDC058401]|uniref:hypothetical protein n=1 Tax=Streptomyces sp. NPDC058401 TaxID=3346480 RepID=UPI00364B667F